MKNRRSTFRKLKLLLSMPIVIILAETQGEANGVYCAVNATCLLVCDSTEIR